jgi:hypothetical protein
VARYTSVNVDPAAAADLRLFAAQSGGQLGRRVTMSDALRYACRIASAHMADLPPVAAELAPPTPTEGTDQ